MESFTLEDVENAIHRLQTELEESGGVTGLGAVTALSDIHLMMQEKGLLEVDASQLSPSQGKVLGEAVQHHHA